MKNRFVILYYLLLISILSISCKKDLWEDMFGCDGHDLTKKTEKVEGFKKNFTVSIPGHWKTELYYDAGHSVIMTADTTRFYTDAFTLDFTVVEGKMIPPGRLLHGLDSVMRASGFSVLRDTLFQNGGMPAALHWSRKGEADSQIHVLQYYLIIDPEKYLQTQCKIFGDKQVDERLCEALAVIKTIEINKH